MRGSRLARIVGLLLAASGLAVFAWAVVLATERGGMPWYGFAAIVCVPLGLILAGAPPRPAPPYNANDHGQS